MIMTISNRGAIDAAKRTKMFVQQVFDYTLVYGKCIRNPAKDLNLSMLLPKTIKKHYAAITDPRELAKLLRAIDNYQGGIVVKSALQLAPLVMARPSEISNAEWSEIDFDSATWMIPAKRRKLPMHLKKVNRPEDNHIIPLSSQAFDILRNIQQYTRLSKYIFPSARGNSAAMSNNALRTALRSMNYDNDTITAHGFRGVASTLLNEQGFRTKVIEAQLGHRLKDEVEASYNHAEYLDERRQYPLKRRLMVIEIGLSSMRPNYVSFAKKHNMSVAGIRYWCASEELRWIRNRIRDLALEAKDGHYKPFFEGMGVGKHVIDEKCSVRSS